MKLGTLASETNFIAWQDYVPSRFWLVSPYDAQKLEHSQYVALSAQFGSGHAERRRDALQILGDMGEEAVDKHVFAEAAALAGRRAPFLRSRTLFAASGQRSVAGPSSCWWTSDMHVHGSFHFSREGCGGGRCEL